MSLITDMQFAARVGAYVRNFKQKGDYLWNFSCPICGDSKKRKGLARGYIYRQDDRLRYKCHNCELPAITFAWFLKNLNVDFYREYVIARAHERNRARKDAPKKDWKTQIKEINFERTKVIVDPLAGLPTLASLPDDHPAKSYIVGRKIPDSFLSVLLFAEDFADVVDKWKDGNGPALVHEPRIIIPFRNRKRLLAIQGRSLDPNTHLRYITIKADDETPKIFGLDRIDLTAPRIYVLEGPFDSMFLPNALAMAGSDLPSILPKNKTIVVYDDEPRNLTICDKIEKAIKQGYRVCIWPRRFSGSDLKDINQRVLAGESVESIIKMIEANSYEGMSAKSKLAKWRSDNEQRKSKPGAGKRRTGRV